jgi:hypothetical protein
MKYQRQADHSERLTMHFLTNSDGALDLIRKRRRDEQTPEVIQVVQELWVRSSVADPDLGLFYPLDPEFGSGMNFFRIPGVCFFGEILRVGCICHPSFVYSRIRNENCWDPDPG